MTPKEKENLISQFALLVNSIPDECDAQIPGEEKDKKIKLLTVKECTNAIDGLTEFTVRQLVAQGKLANIRSGTGKRGKILIPQTALENYFGK